MFKAALLVGVGVGVGFFVAAAAVPVSDALACGFIDYRPIQPIKRMPPKARPIAVAAVDRIATANQRLDEERLAAAATEVVLAFPNVRTIDVGASPLGTRALRILALAVVRSEGALAGVHGFTATTDSQRAANVEWAVSTLRQVNAVRPNDPVALADLGEALAARTKYEGEALGILQELSDRDLMGSAHAYAALARLHASHGRIDEVHGAVGRCELMAREPAAVCHAPDLRVASGD